MDLAQELRGEQAQENTLSSALDARWGDIGATHRSYLELFLSKLPPSGDVLDAACGTGKYFGLVLDSSRHVTESTIRRAIWPRHGRSSRKSLLRSSTSRNFPTETGSTG